MKSTIARNLLAIGFLFLAGNTHGATRIWDGGGLDGLSSNPLNWDGNATSPTTIVDTLQVGANTVGGIPFIAFDSGEFRTPTFTFLASAVAPYTVTAVSSGNDSLMLTGTGVALLNSSPVRQRFELITTTLGSSQTWDGGEQGLVMSSIDLGQSNTLTVTGTGTTAGTRNEIVGTISGNIGSTSGLTKAGPGTLLLNNAGFESSYAGPTTLESGRLLLGSAHQIPNGSKLVLNGGIFDTGGFSETVGALSLGGDVTIDFGSSDSVALVFADSRFESWSDGTLNIVNFNSGADSLRFGSNFNALTGLQLSQISFAGLEAGISNEGFLYPVPEPSVSAAILSALGFIGFGRRRQRNRQSVD